MSNEVNLVEELKKQIEETGWNDLQPHYERGAVYIIDKDLELEEVGAEMAEDDHSRIKQYLEDGQMYPPLKEEVKAWSENPTIKFSFLIVQPYVLIKRV